MGAVYRARDPRLARDVAVKVLPEEVAADPDRLKRFEQEARSVGALDHPNILTVHDVGVEAGTPYIVTELLEDAAAATGYRLDIGPFPGWKDVPTW
jgi:serine/threonine protein kinase